MSTIERCSFCPGTYYASYFSAPLPDGFQLPILTDPGLLAHRAFLERRTTGQYRKLVQVDSGYGACCEFCLEDGYREMMKDWYFVWSFSRDDIRDLLEGLWHSFLDFKSGFLKER